MESLLTYSRRPHTVRSFGLDAAALALYGIALCSIALWPRALSPQGGPTAQLELRFTLQETELNANHQQRLRRFAREAARRAPYSLVQGFACDVGGYAVSQRVAAARGTAVLRELRPLLAKPAALNADSIVIYGPNATARMREEHRRVVVQAFTTAAERAAAQQRANREAEQLNAVARAGLRGEANAANSRHSIEAGDAQSPNTTGARTNSADGERAAETANTDGWLYGKLLLILLLVALIGSAVWSILIGRSQGLARRTATVTANAINSGAGSSAENESSSQPHELDESEAASLAILTGGAVEALPKRSSAKSKPAKDPDPNRSVSLMAAQRKKAKSKITPISIRGAVDRDFADKSLGELSRAPIDALEGLTPRHARMLEEAFGVKTVEDLARLKYVEIARAIVVLAHYEK